MYSGQFEKLSVLPAFAGSKFTAAPPPDAVVPPLLLEHAARIWDRLRAPTDAPPIFSMLRRDSRRWVIPRASDGPKPPRSFGSVVLLHHETFLRGDREGVFRLPRQRHLLALTRCRVDTEVLHVHGEQMAVG